MSNHLQSVGQLVGNSPTTTKLATLVQLDPLYVYFTMAETDVQRILAEQKKISNEAFDISKVPVEIGLQTETGFPHKGHLDYASPVVDSSTGTLQVRAVLENHDRALLPGYFVRVHLPVDKIENALLVPGGALGTDQSGRYLLIVGADGTVEQRVVQVGASYGTMKLIESGLKADDKVVVVGMQRAVPGLKVNPQMQAPAPAPAPAAAPAK